MSGTATELFDLVARWVHVIAGIMWIGNSLLFNWLDRLLVEGPSKLGDPAQRAGQVWLLHSGGFYYVEKTLLAGQNLPVPLHWFKWQAYTTWLSGAALLIVVYYIGGRAILADSAFALSHSMAVAVGAGSIVGGWLLYESMNRFVASRAPTVSFVIWAGALIAISVALTQLLSGRAAFLHVGAMLGTIMAGNVFLTIVPSQRQLVASVTEGRAASAEALSARAKRVSIHNNYFTFPVIVLMVSSHFPTIYGHRWSWALLLVLIAGGAAVRHALNARFTTSGWRIPLAASVVSTIVVLYVAMTSRQGVVAPAVADSSPVSFTEARQVLDRRCAACHSAQPSDMSFGVAPGGVKLDTPVDISRWSSRILERAVVTRTMPPANKTNISEEERSLLARWVAQGAVTR